MTEALSSLEKVSIIIPAYNAQKYLLSALRSIEKQTHQNYEVLVVDDCSLDDTFVMAKKKELLDPKIKVLQTSVNSGPGLARNIALKNISPDSKYVAFLDADDYWHPQKLEKQIAFMRANNAVISHTNYVFTDEYLSPSAKGRQDVNARVDLATLMKTTQMTPSATMISTSVLCDFEMPSKRMLGEDTQAWMSLLRKGHVSHGLGEDLTLYRVHPSHFGKNKIKSAAHQAFRYMKETSLSPQDRARFYFCYLLNAVHKRRKENPSTLSSQKNISPAEIRKEFQLSR